MSLSTTAVRCAPHQSWTNLAERCMSILNLALQNVALQREMMSEDLEKYASDVSTLSELRGQSTKLGFRAAYSRSMQPVIDLLNSHFARMKLKETPFSVYTGARETDIQEMFEEILQVDKLVMKELKKAGSCSHF